MDIFLFEVSRQTELSLSPALPWKQPHFDEKILVFGMMICAERPLFHGDITMVCMYQLCQSTIVFFFKVFEVHCHKLGPLQRKYDYCDNVEIFKKENVLFLMGKWKEGDKFSVPQIEYQLGGSSKRVSHVYFLLQVFWRLLASKPARKIHDICIQMR